MGTSDGNNHLIKPSEYLKSISDKRSSGSSGRWVHNQMVFDTTTKIIHILLECLYWLIVQIEWIESSKIKIEKKETKIISWKVIVILVIVDNWSSNGIENYNKVQMENTHIAEESSVFLKTAQKMD